VKGDRKVDHAKSRFKAGGERLTGWSQPAVKGVKGDLNGDHAKVTFHSGGRMKERNVILVFPEFRPPPSAVKTV